MKNEENADNVIGLARAVLTRYWQKAVNLFFVVFIRIQF